MQAHRQNFLCRLLSGLLTSLALCACSPQARFEGIDITGADYAQQLELTDSAGQLRSLKDFAGRVVVVFFGYTQCPDVCPTTLSEMSTVKKALGPDGERLQVVFVSLDPERDSAQLLQHYMANFDPGFVALRPTLEQLPAVARHFKIYYKKVDGKTPNSYTLDHSAGSYVLDGKGQVRLFLRYGMNPAAVEHDIRELLKGA